MLRVDLGVVSLAFITISNFFHVMENHDKFLHHSSSPSRTFTNSATSGIDLSSSAAGIVSPAPPSPSLEPSDSTLARRRSWGNRLREAGRQSSSSPDPVHFDLDAPAHTPSSSRRPATNNSAGPAMPAQGDDPFYVLTDEHVRNHPYAIDSARHYGPRTGVDTYMSSVGAGPSMANLMPHPTHFEPELYDGHREDDEAHLTANMSTAGMVHEGYLTEDPESDGGATPRSGKRTVRYSISPSPLKKTESAMKSVTKNLRRMSLRVVNLANTGLEGQLRLGDGDDVGGKGKKAEDSDGPPAPDLKQVLPIRGRTLGFLGPDSKVRLSLFNFLVHP